MQSDLWIPEDVEELLLVTIAPKHSVESEWEMMQLLNSAAKDWLSGKLDTATYQDILETAGFEPDVFIEKAESHVLNIIKTL